MTYTNRSSLDSVIDALDSDPLADLAWTTENERLAAIAAHNKILAAHNWTDDDFMTALENRIDLQEK